MSVNYQKMLAKFLDNLTTPNATWPKLFSSGLNMSPRNLAVDGKGEMDGKGGQVKYCD
jgi:hypothetical protein